MIESVITRRQHRRARQLGLNYDEAARKISATTLADLTILHAEARREDRQTILAAAVEEIVTVLAHVDAAAPQSRERLEKLGREFPQLVLEGTFQQQFACKLATRLALPRATPLPLAVMQLIVDPLTTALIAVLTVGAPATRDAAVEGLGGLLRLHQLPAQRFPLPSPLRISRESGEPRKTFVRRARISAEYFERLERRRLLVLTVANDPDSCREFLRKLEQAIQPRIARLVGQKAWRKVEDTLYEYPDLLRILPAVARQNAGISLNSAALLCDAARLTSLQAEAPEGVELAFARYQENIFRTIDTALRRFAWDWDMLDDVIAAAIRALPQAADGTTSMSNAKIRTTVALLRTASRVMASAPAPLTSAALKHLWATRQMHTPWANLGILEGCCRTLPELLPHGAYDDVTEPLVEWMVAQLSRPRDCTDFFEVHSHLVAGSVFRRVLAGAMDRAQSNGQDVEADVRELLHEPTVDHVFRLWRQNPARGVRFVVRNGGNIAPSVIAAIVFESELLARTRAMFEGWKQATAFEQVLLARILALQLHTSARDTRELDRHPLLQRLLADTAHQQADGEDGVKRVYDLLSSLPAEAAEPADAEIQRFIEFRGEGVEESGSALPGHVLAMISTTVSSRIAGTIAREVDSHLRSERSRSHAGDFAKLLYEVTLRGPHESVFDHLLPRIRSEHDRNTVLFFRRHVASVLASSSDDDSNPDVTRIIADIVSLSDDLKTLLLQHSTPTLSEMHTALLAFGQLTQASENVWSVLAGETMVDLFSSLDALAGSSTHRQLLKGFKRQLTDLQDDIVHYLALPIGRFEERRITLSRMMDSVAELESAIRGHRGLHPPERTLLIALLRHHRSLFDDTRRWACDEARKLKERNDRDGFWLLFCDPRKPEERIAAFARLMTPTRMSVTTLAFRYNLERVRAQILSAPRAFPLQRDRFESFFVDWMTSELDVQTLKRTLRHRWPWYFKGIYAITTNFWLASIAVVAPFLLAGWLTWANRDEWAGIGFFAITAGILLVAAFSFIEALHWMAAKIRDETKTLPGYWFQCLLPRLARLTAVPMALIVEFDHSYDFPLHASTWSILLLAALSFFTTRFFVTRELVDQEERPGVTKISSGERKRVRQIVAVALSHSFGIAIILSSIFASTHPVRDDVQQKKPSVEVEVGKPSPFWLAVEVILEKVDNVTNEHEGPLFLGFVPREVKVEIGPIAKSIGKPLPSKVAEHLAFSFYPTIILVWTALGLFFGVFLEGFMKGERLRGIAMDKPDAQPPPE